MATAKEHAGMLAEVGLDFGGMIGRENAVVVMNGGRIEADGVGLGVTS